MVCYACQSPATAMCSRCRRDFCTHHGAAVCAVCSLPASMFPSAALYRSTAGASAALLLLAVAYILWWPEFVPIQSYTVLAGVRSGVRPAADAPSPRAQTQGGGSAEPARPGAASPAPQVVAVPEPPRKYTVAAGDTLLAIALRLDVTVDELKRLNGLAGDAVLGIGQELLVSAPTAPPGAASAATPSQSRTYTVAAGDTLVDIAQRYGTAVEDIVRRNGLRDAASLRIGQELVLAPVTLVSAASASAPASPSAATPPAPRKYAVVSGDTLFDIARRAGTTVETLMRLNGLADASSLSLGQELTLP